LAIVVEREKKIREFKPRDYWEVEADFTAKAGSYKGKWFDEGFKGKNDDEHARADRLWEQNKADAIRAATLGKPGDVTEEAKPETRLSPALFRSDHAAARSQRRFGFSAKTTLSLAQALYEKHKVLTYPRTDSRCLEDYLPTVKETLTVLTGEGAGKGHDEVLLARYSPFAHQILARNWVRPTSASSTTPRSATTSPSSRRRRRRKA
jgi:DNA topoisomerase-3